MHVLDHQRLDAYRIARELHRELDVLLRASPRVRQDLIDQLRRAAASIVLNIAEGAGEWTPREKARFYRTAKRSATEVSACLDLLEDVGAVNGRGTEHVRSLLERTFAMLVRLAKASEPRPGAPKR